MPASLRCVFYDPDAVDADSHLSARAFEACARAEVEVFALAGEDAVELEDEPQLDRVRHARAGLHAASSASASAPRWPDAPLSAVWVSPLDLEVRGPTVRVAEEGDELLYEAVISELAQRR